ncbi:hypothetical protein [Virgibacillus salexigens]|uniref:Uncharacterized protein n=1 Tax=Virgibacillus massiliensis TaxID=1462526 RepID=A0A024QJK5_9BACI|nr:hypothetical protein [Virgibacillus massiliensis]CDQ42126.1 hypothetical protein BN990_04506 [Virgibacillus massiliensis]
MVKLKRAVVIMDKIIPLLALGTGLYVVYRLVEVLIHETAFAEAIKMIQETPGADTTDFALPLAFILFLGGIAPLALIKTFNFLVHKKEYQERFKKEELRRKIT